MGLSVDDRGMLEKIIDAQIKQIPKYVEFARDEHVKKGLMLNSDYDFVMGQAYNGIVSSFSSYYFNKITTMLTILNVEEFKNQMQEIVNVIINRMPEIRKAIFDCG